MQTLIKEKEIANCRIRIPIARIQLKMKTPVYEYTKDGLQKIPNTYLPTNSTHFIVKRNEDLLELMNGNFIYYASNNFLIYSSGEIKALKNGVRVCSKNGYVLRELPAEQVVQVNNIVNSQFSTLYQINESEWISDLEPICFTIGYYKPDQLVILNTTNGYLSLNPNKWYPYGNVDGNRIHLEISKGFWLDVNEHRGTFSLGEDKIYE